MQTKYIFIVGVSRSGTTLMRLILNSSSQVSIADENHFMGHLIPSEGMRYKFKRFGDLQDDGNVHRLVDFMYSDAFVNISRLRDLSHHWVWITNSVPREEFLQRVLASDRTEKALFEIMVRVLADYLGKPVAGEKTPAHVKYIPELMQWFPNGKGKVIHMLRDPRGIFASEYRRRKELPITIPYKQLNRFDLLFKLYITLQTTIIWLDSVNRYRRYKKAFPQSYYLQKFEDLIADPDNQIRKLCQFLQIEFEDKMLEQKVFSRGFKLGQTGFDTKAGSRWKGQISPWTERLLSFVLHKYLKMFNYPS